MRYVITQCDDNRIKEYLCYDDCDTCSSRFKCFTSSIIIEESMHLSGEAKWHIIKKLEEHGINAEWYGLF
jgi:hypothetical protein